MSDEIPRWYLLAEGEQEDEVHEFQHIEQLARYALKHFDYGETFTVWHNHEL